MPVADHLRGAVFLAADGVTPGNKEQGYVMRRLVRRALRYGMDLGLAHGVAADVVPVVAAIYADVYPEVAERQDAIVAVLAREEKAFARTLGKGLARMRKLTGTVTAESLFELHDTYGMPVELAVEEVRRGGLPLDPSWASGYAELVAAQRARSRAGRP
jgi:alanyl-tRNA synthetase